MLAFASTCTAPVSAKSSSLFCNGAAISSRTIRRTSELRSRRVSPAPTKDSDRTISLRAALDALIFDCDGVLADTERDAHRVAFNMAFSEVPPISSVSWDEALYGKLLETGGGKERMTRYFSSVAEWPADYPDEESRTQLVKQLHKRKTELFMQLVDSGKVPLRAGVDRLVKEARAKGIPVAVCSTSNEKAVSKIVDMLGEDIAKDIRIFAGDIVKKKKPSPDIYDLAKNELGLNPSNVCVVEDSYIGVQAARGAGMPVIVTKSTYTKNEDFSDAQKIVNSLDDPITSLEDLTAMVESMSVSA